MDPSIQSSMWFDKGNDILWHPRVRTRMEEQRTPPPPEAEGHTRPRRRCPSRHTLPPPPRSRGGCREWRRRPRRRSWSSMWPHEVSLSSLQKCGIIYRMKHQNGMNLLLMSFWHLQQLVASVATYFPGWMIRAIQIKVNKRRLSS